MSDWLGLCSPGLQEMFKTQKSIKIIILYLQGAYIVEILGKYIQHKSFLHKTFYSILKSGTQI